MLKSALAWHQCTFQERFDYVEAGAKKQARKMSEMTLDEMETLWQEAKSNENQ